MTTVLLLRHGETALNRSGMLRGQIDVPLTDIGKREAVRLAQRVRNEYALRALYSSPLGRAHTTADALASTTGVAVTIDRRFTDIDYGRWAGRSPDGLLPAERDAFRRWQQQPEVPLPGAEDPRAVQDRAFAALVDLTGLPDSCIAVVTHDAVLQLILCRILGIEVRSYRGIAQHTATLNELVRTGEVWAVQLLNSTWHLDPVE